jgi:hypothetical protein
VDLDNKEKLKKTAEVLL